MKKNKSYNICNYFRNTNKCRQKINNEFVKCIISENDYHVSPYVNEWLNNLKNNKKYGKTF